MALAQMAFGIHLDNKQKRKASAIDVFVNVESQRKFLKCTTAAGMGKELQYAAEKYCDLQEENNKLKRELNEKTEQEQKYERLWKEYNHNILDALETRRENERLEGENSELKRELGKRDPPRRPGHKTVDWTKTCKKNILRADLIEVFEEGCSLGIEDGFDHMHGDLQLQRLSNVEWRNRVKSRVYPHNPNVDWEEYCEWAHSGRSCMDFKSSYELAGVDPCTSCSSYGW